MPRGRPIKVITDNSDLSGHEEAEIQIAEVLHGAYCAIPGCQPKWHREEAQAILRTLIRLNLIKDSD